MAQLSTNTIFYDQLIKRIQKFLVKNATNTFASEEEAAAEYHQILTDVNNYSSEPISNYEQVIKGEPPSSSKFNRFLSNAADDLNIVAKQLDYQSAQVVSMYNLFNSEIEKETSFANRIKSKVRILQAYSESPGNDLYYFGDSFENMDFIDIAKTPANSLLLIKDGSAQLPITSTKEWKTKSISIIEEDSNGFIGNNHMAYAMQGGETAYRYAFQDNNSLGLIKNIIDSNPLTYFEYEGVNIDKALTKAKNAKDFEFLVSYEETNNGNKTTKFKSWAEKNTAEPLKLSLKLTSASSQQTNTVSIVPYFGTVANTYSEMKIVKITAISQSTKQLVDLISKPIYIGSSFVPQSIESSKNYFYNKAVISFPEITTNEINIYFEQNNYDDITAQHLYWQPIPSDSNMLAKLDTKNRFDPSSLSSLGLGDVQYNVTDLIPNILQPNFYKDKSVLENKVLNITFKSTAISDKYLVSFERAESATPGAATQKMYYTNYATGLESAVEQQLKTATSDINSAFRYESAEIAQRNLEFITSKISGTSPEWSTYKYQSLKVETIKSNLAPKTLSTSIWLKKQFEIYPAKRAAIGLRSVDAYFNACQSYAELVSKPFVFPYNVKNLTISTESSGSMSKVDYNQTYIKYYISLDDGAKWIQISPIENPFNAVPEILSFNENLQGIAGIKGVSYFDYPIIPLETTNVRLKIEIEKPSYETASPLIYSYKISGRVEQA